MSIFHLKGHKLWYEETRRGAALVLLHDAANDHRPWNRQVAALVRVVCVEMT